MRLGAGGVEEVIELPLERDELAALRRSADKVREGIDALGT